MYIIQEIQTTNGQTSLVTPITREDWNQAISVFHEKASYAAISNVETHTIMLYDEWGNMGNCVSFTHSQDEGEQ